MLYPYAISRENVNRHRVWIAKSLHLKGCVAQGDTRLEAIKELESNEIAWLELDGVFYAICSCVTKTRFSVFINVDG